MSHNNNNGNNLTRNLPVLYTSLPSTSVSPVNQINATEANIVLHELQSKLDGDYSKTHTSQGPVPLPPANIETKAIQLVKEKSSMFHDFKSTKDLARSIMGNWNTFLTYAKNEFEEKYDEIFGTTWERAMAKASKEHGWSEIQKTIFACKETLTPLFVNKTSPIIQKGISLFGTDFETFSKSTFMTNVVQDLLEFIIKQIYAGLGGPGAGNSNSWRDILIELALLILKWILFLLVQLLIRELLPGYPFIASFLRIIPFFIKYIINQLRNNIRK